MYRRRRRTRRRRGYWRRGSHSASSKVRYSVRSRNWPADKFSAPPYHSSEAGPFSGRITERLTDAWVDDTFPQVLSAEQPIDRMSIAPTGYCRVFTVHSILTTRGFRNDRGRWPLLAQARRDCNEVGKTSAFVFSNYSASRRPRGFPVHIFHGARCYALAHVACRPALTV